MIHTGDSKGKPSKVKVRYAKYSKVHEQIFYKPESLRHIQSESNWGEFAFLGNFFLLVLEYEPP